MESHTLLQELEDFLREVELDHLLSEVQQQPDASSVPFQENLSSLESVNSTIDSQLDFYFTAPESNLTVSPNVSTSKQSTIMEHQSTTIPPVQPLNTVEKPKTTHRNSSKSNGKSRRKHWQDWKDEMLDQLSKRTEDPQFKVKQCMKSPLRPKPYDKFTSHYKLE